MESRTVVGVPNANNCSDTAILNQPAVSAVPDLVTNMPGEKCSLHTSSLCEATVKSDQTSTPVQDPPSADTILTAASAQHNSSLKKTKAQPSVLTEAPAKNRNTREEKSRKKDDKSVDHVLKALNSLSTPEEKLAAMCKKYADFFDEHRKLQVLQKQTEKRCSLLQREKEQLQAEHSKAILTRSRLENLCRELQRQNKAIKDESLLKIREEEEKRKEVSAKFQTTMNEITSLMQQNSDKHMKLRDDNIDMSTKLKSICEQYEFRQQQIETISNQMHLEQQLSEAKLAKFKLEMSAERELMLKEKQELLLELQQYRHRCTEFQATELNLRNQISFYNDKYDEFQKSLARSSDVVGGFKGEMERMTKKICKLEKETSSWKLRWERSNNIQLEMAAAKQKSDQEMAVVSRQLVTLQNLCRTLQTERSNLLTKLKLLQDNQAEPREKLVMNSLNKCSKQCSQNFNHVEPLNHTDQPMTNVSESDPLLSQYTQDILTSLKEIEKPKDTSTNSVPATPFESDVKTSCVTSSHEIPVPVTSIPLPDVIGTPNVYVLNEQQDRSSDLCTRLENEATTNQKVSVTQENSNTNQPSYTPAVEEVLRVNEHTNHTLTNQTVPLEENSPQIQQAPVINGNLFKDNSLPTDQDPSKDIPKQSLELLQTLAATEIRVESLDCGKKSKEPKKKKK